MKRVLTLTLCLILALVAFTAGCSGKTEDGGYNGVNIPDFIVDIPVGKSPVILQLTDTQTIDASQMRTKDRLNASSAAYYAKENVNIRLNDHLDQIIEEVSPDFILLTGDMIYGEFDDSGSQFAALVRKMDSFGIPWAPIFGNHEAESAMGADWQCSVLENAEFCLFKQRDITGNGNYTVGITQGGKLIRIFFMMDSNGTGHASEETLANGHTKKGAGFGDDQVAWFEEIGAKLKKNSPKTKISFAFHIPMNAFYDAYEQYGFTRLKNAPVNIDAHPDKAEMDFGYIGTEWGTGWDANGEIFAKMKVLGVDSIYCGHEHANSASAVFDGVRFQFGQKIATYDALNWLLEDGTVKFAYPGQVQGTPIMGGTVHILNDEGEIANAYIHYISGNPNE